MSLLGHAVPPSSVSALSYPSAFAPFPLCAADSDEFCVEKLEFTPTGGPKQDIANPAPNYMSDPNSLSGRTSPYVGTFLSGAYTGPGSVNPNMPSGMAINFYNPLGSIRANPSDITVDGLENGLYRVVVRTGDYDPTIMMLSGKYESLVVTKGSDGYFTIDLSLRPSPIARVVVLDGDSNALNSCIANKWLASCEANQAERGYALASFGMVSDGAMRDSLRGTWITSNASTVELAPGNFLAGEFNVNAQGPHFVPNDFGISGLTQEGSRYVNPAYFEMFVPYTMIAKVVSTKMNQVVTVDMVKAFLDSPTQVMEGTIEEAASPTAAIVKKAQTLTFTKLDIGVRVNFNLTNYSAPNPSLKIKSVGTTAATTSPATSQTRKLSNGATVKIPAKVSKGKSLTGKALLSPSKGATITKMVSRSTSVCKVVGTRVKMLKTGTCRLAVTVKLKSKSTTSTVSFKVS